MTKKLTLPETAEYLKTHDDYLILTHRRPDGDTVGSAAALCRMLRAIGKRAAVYPNPQITPKFAPYWTGLTGTGGGTLVSVDVAGPHLFPYGMENAKVDLAIDHHGTNSGFAARTYADETHAACGEILISLCPLLGARLDRSMGEALYVAISTDTGCFRYSNVTANTLRTAAELLEAGVDAYAVNRKMFELKRFARLKLEAYLTETMRFYADGRIGVCLIPADIRRRLGLTEDDVDDISGFARMIEGVELAAMLRQMPGATKLSLRSGRLYDSGAICKRLGGGGHFSAAGASLHPDPAEAERQLLRAIYAIYPELCPAES